jgi:pyruvate formate lyase activating enzyme
MIALNENRPLIVDVKRNSLEDGPGIRSVVFFKGCPLRCIFCHNPETQETGVEIAFSAKDCIKCGNCKEACHRETIDLENPEHIIRDRCDRCGECVKACPGNGLRAIGAYYTVEELTEILLRDISFYRHSNGGVTLSGGECTMYPNYLEALLQQLKANNIHTALETSGYFEYDVFSKKILPYVDLIYYDIKIADVDSHAELIGQSNERIINNLQRLLKEKGVEVHPRIPLVPGITATHENLSSIVSLLYKMGADKISLLPYNPMGIEMYAKLGRQKPHLSESFMKPDEEKGVYEIFKTIIEEQKKYLQYAPC